jgi:hypothetical protein
MHIAPEDLVVAKLEDITLIGENKDELWAVTLRELFEIE